MLFVNITVSNVSHVFMKIVCYVRFDVNFLEITGLLFPNWFNKWQI